MHRQLSDANIDGSDAETGRRDGADRGTAEHVVTRNERLHGNVDVSGD